METYQKKFKCLDQDEMKLRGDFNSASAQLLALQLKRCEESATIKCKS